MTNEIYEELIEVVKYASTLREFESCLYTLVEENNKGRMTLSELHEIIKKIVMDDE